MPLPPIPPLTLPSSTRSKAASLLELLDENEKDEKVILKAFRKKAAKVHPDKNRDNIEIATKQFQLLTKAKDLLLKPPPTPLQLKKEEEKEEKTDFPSFEKFYFWMFKVSVWGVWSCQKCKKDCTRLRRDRHVCVCSHSLSEHAPEGGGSCRKMGCGCAEFSLKVGRGKGVCSACGCPLADHRNNFLWNQNFKERGGGGGREERGSNPPPSSRVPKTERIDRARETKKQNFGRVKTELRRQKIGEIASRLRSFEGKEEGAGSYTSRASFPPPSSARSKVVRPEMGERTIEELLRDIEKGRAGREGREGPLPSAREVKGRR